jgi:phospholipid-transporting ATPase
MEKHSYIDFGSTNEATGYITQFLTFWVAYSHLIPISLYVALEVLKLFLAFLINEDKDLFHEGNMAKCKSSDLIEELGQIEFVFSDKTGTLTRNEMIFRKCMVNGIIYGKSTSDFGTEASLEYQVMRLVRNKEHPYLLSFCRFMSLCNSVFPVSSNDEIKYQGSSPDELALITGASNLGVKLIDKVDNMTFLKVLGTSETWETIIEVPFTSDRKRMSVVVRDPQSHKLILMTKGADSVILPLLNEKIAAQVSLEVSAFANEGLRSLVMASRQIPGNEFHDWHEKWKKASLSNDPSKDSQLSQLASDLEHDLEFIGCSGIEDRLQEGVPSTIESLMSAGIRVWVLTGDKEETAVEIGKSCNLIRRNMELLQLSSSSVSELTSKLNLQSEKYSLEILSFRDLELAKATLPFEICIVINGQTLAWALSDLQLKKTFFKLGFLALSCICCRVSPAQKAEVVKLAKTYGKWITLAIGDGANDVSMIQEAHIGIGISGKEGAQASQSADFVFDQFRFLNKFLLVHGRWGYKRVSWFICYYFYKNIAVVFTEIWFALYNGFSGQIFFMDWLPLLYNSFWTSWPCLIAYALEQDIDSFESLRLPELYRIGQKQSYFNFRNFWKWVIFAVWHGSVSYWISTLTTSVSVDPAGGMKSLFWVSTLSFSVIINIVTLKLFLENLHWTWMSL